MNLHGSTEINLRFLGELGVPPKELDKVRDQIFKTDQIALDATDNVAWSRVVQGAKAVGVTLPTAQLESLFATRGDVEPKIVSRVETDYPIPLISGSGRDANVTVDSKKTVLAEGGGAKISKKSTLEWLFLRRTKAENGSAGFELHGFANDKIAVDVPEGGTLVIVDSRGNQRGYGLRPVELTPSMMGEKAPFTVKVLNKERKIVLEETLAFAGGMTRGSRLITAGTFSKRPAGDAKPELPRFSIGEQNDVDRVVVKRDGKSFAIERYEQLLCPPRLAPQSIKADGVTFTLRSNNGEPELDDPAYSWVKTAKIHTSNGETVTLDWSLKESMRAKWTADGLAIFKPHQEKPSAVFDPFFGA